MLTNKVTTMNYFTGFLFLVLQVFLHHSTTAQTVSFSDTELERFLINEMCVDTTQNGLLFSNDRSVDVNNDNQIQLTEAESVRYLEIYDLHDSFNIQSINDLQVFPNLEYVKILHIDSLAEVQDLQLPNLKTLWMGSNATLRIVDISNLPNLTKDLRIESIDTLDYLNIQNGSITEYFSLFYSDRIKYACVDSIAAEYDEVAWKMLIGTPSFENCPDILSVRNIAGSKPMLNVYPNPTTGICNIEVEGIIDNAKVFSAHGVETSLEVLAENKVDLGHMVPGLYFLVIESDGAQFTQKVLKR